VITGVQPLSAAGIFLGICYLPGLTVLALIKKESLKIEDLILAYPCSIGISSLLTLGLLYSGVHAGHAAYIIFIIFGSLVLFHLIKNKSAKLMTVDLSAGETGFVIAALFMTLLFSVPVVSERIAISHHGFHHFSLVTNISNGFFPPENPGMGGEPIGYHWGYHAFVAAISYPVNLNPLRTFSMLNIVSLFFLFCISYRSARTFALSKGFCWISPVVLIGLMRSDAVIYFVKNVILEQFPLVRDTASAPLNLLTSWVGGASYLDTRLFFMNKFYNANNMPVGLCLLFAFFLIILLRQEGKAENKKRYLLTIVTFVLAAIALNYAFFLIALLAFVPVWADILFITGSGRMTERYKEVGELILPCIIAAVITGPYLLKVASGGSVITAGKDVGDFEFIYINVQTIKNLIVLLLPLPVILFGFRILYKHLGFSRTSLFLFAGSFVFLALAAFLRLNWSNSAKFSFILSFMFSFPFAFALQWMYGTSMNRLVTKTLISFIVLILLFTPFLTEAAYIFSPWFRDGDYEFKGRHIAFARDRTRNEAYAWIRENTPPETLILLPFFASPRAPGGITIAQSFSYRTSALMERSLFVIKDVYAYVSPEFNERATIRELLFSDPRNNKVQEYLMTINRPIYLLEEDVNNDPLLHGITFDRRPGDAPDIFKPIFNNDRQRIYEINYTNKVERSKNLK
jgi:hypothetical protein